jgi:serine/threonine protein kinase
MYLKKRRSFSSKEAGTMEMNGNISEKTQDLTVEEIEADLKYHGLEIVRLISDKGGMADVYEAWQPSVKRRIAAKRLKSHLIANPDVRARFEEEAMLLGRLNHPNIVQVIDYSSEKLTLFMEFIEGKPLDEVLAERGRLPLEEALHIVSVVLEGLSYAHARNIIHRDVKPGNIFLTSEGLIKLGDFGIAAIIGPETRCDESACESWVGTPSYVAPEQMRGKEVDGRADLYAVGVTLYLLLTGRLPFIGENSTRTASMRLTHNPDPPSKLNPMISAELESVVLKAMARSPEERYRTAQEFKQAVDTLLAPRRDLAYLQEAKAELEKSRQAATTQKKQLLVSCVKLSQMVISENPDNPEAKNILSEAKTELDRVHRKEYTIIGVLAAVIMAVIVILSVQIYSGKGSLDLFTNEPADVFLDGVKIGTAPFIFANLPSGTHRLYVEQPGFFKSSEREVRIEKGKVIQISESIPDGGTIVVSSAQPGTSVLLDGVEIGRTPLTLKVVIGKHQLSVAGEKRDILVLEEKNQTYSFSKKK